MVDTTNSKSGDVINGYVLLANGTWVPLQQNTSTARASEFSVGTSVVLSIVTLGIWQLVWMYKAMHLYRERSGRDGQELDTLY